MMRMRLRAGLLGLLLCSTPAAGQRCPSCGESSSRRVFDAAAIAARAWHHLGDIVEALPPGSSASVDGFNASLTGSRIGFMEASGSTLPWMIRLDGQPMPMTIGGLWLFDAIPVAITQLDSIVVTVGPTLTDGRMSVPGVIDLYTRRPRRGVSALGDYQHGDESGDPGPYRYTARSTPNLEKIGPFASGAVAGAGGSGSIDIAARYSSVNITDPRIQQRLPAGSASSLQSDVNASGGSGVLRLALAGGTQSVIAGRGRFMGLMHLPATGVDQAAHVIASHAGITGNAGPRSLRYGISATQLDVNPLGTVLPAEDDERFFGDAFVEASFNHARVGAGTELGRRHQPAVTTSRRVERAWAAFFTRAVEVTFAIQDGSGNAGAAAALKHQRVFADSTPSTVTLTALNAWDASPHAWMDGFGTAERVPHTSGVDARVELGGREAFGFRPSWYIRAFAIDQETNPGTTKAVAAGGSAQRVIGSQGWAVIRAEVSQPAGSATLGESSVPSGFVEGSMSTTTPGGFQVAFGGRYAPGTKWEQRGPGAIEPLSMLDVPATHRVDLSVNKRLWHERIRTQLVLRNLLDARESTHPFGAQWNLRTHVAATVELPPYTRSGQ